MKIKTKHLTVTALFSVAIAACSWVTLPVGTVPLTLQTFAVALAGYTLGKKRGFACTLIYLLMGAIGLPVFSGMQGGLSVFFTHSGGFLLAFPLLCLCCGFGNSKLKRILFGLLGVVICHLIGIIWICFIAKISFLAAFLGASAPFIIKDILCVSVALFAANRVKKEITL